MGYTMPYLLPDDFLTKFRNLRQDYQARSKTKLKKAPHPSWFSKMGGATDVKNREAQISLAEKILASVESSLVKDNKFKTAEQLQDHIHALRVLVSVCSYIESQVGKKYHVRSSSNAKLVQLIKEALGAELDEESRDCVLIAAKRFIQQPLQTINGKLNKQKNITELEWDKFCEFIKTENANMYKKNPQQFSATQLTMPLFKYPAQGAGVVAGYMLFSTLARATIVIPLQYSLIHLITSAARLFNHSGSLGVALVAPTVAGQALSYYSGIGGAAVVGKGMGMFGDAVGWGVGKSIDYSFYSVYCIYSLLASYCFNYGSEKPQYGFDLVGGYHIVDGVEELKFAQLSKEEEETLKNTDPTNIHTNAEGLTVNDKTIPWIQQDLPYIQELKTALSETSPVSENYEETFCKQARV